jgi:type IV pilus assembly protein PilC
MSVYIYKIRSFDGKMETGTVQATTKEEAVRSLRRLGLVLQIKENRSIGQFKFNVSPHLSLKERIIFTEQLAVMLNAGITLVQALKGLAEETSNKSLSLIISHLVADVEGGKSFSEALRRYPKVFSTIYCEMVASAEKTGNMADILNKLTVQQQKEYELKGKVVGALIYPAIVSVLLVAVIILVITFILPKLTGIFTDSGTSLPASTLFLIALSNFFVHDWYVLIISLVIFIVVFRYAVKNPKGAFAWDMFKLKIPVLGSFIKKSYMARFTQSFASLAQAGIPVLDVFKTLEGVIGSPVYEEEIRKISAQVENGIKVSVAIRKSKYFPGMVGQLVSVGEQSGDLAGVFNVLGDFFEKEVDDMARNLSTLLEPIIMIVMGVMVGFVLMAVLQPIYNLSSAI